MLEVRGGHNVCREMSCPASERGNKSLELEEPQWASNPHPKQGTDRSGTEWEHGHGSHEESGQMDTLPKGL